MVDIDLGV
jgi:hypothetical protein